MPFGAIYLIAPPLEGANSTEGGYVIAGNGADTGSVTATFTAAKRIVALNLSPDNTDVTKQSNLCPLTDDCYTIWTMQDYVKFDPEYFSLDASSVSVYSTNVFWATAQDYGNGVDRVFVNHVSTTAVKLDKTVTVMIFDLKALKNGSTTITHGIFSKEMIWRRPVCAGIAAFPWSS